MLAKCMALELGRDKIAVNVVAPGFVDAGLSGKIFQENPAVRELHLALLNGERPVADPLQVWSARERLRRRGPSGLSKEDWALLLSDSDGLKTL